MAWFGMRKDLLLALHNVHARTDKKGNFILRSSSGGRRACEGIVTGYDDEEVLVGDEMYDIDEFDNIQSIRELMRNMPGVNGIKVF